MIPKTYVGQSSLNGSRNNPRNPAQLYSGKVIDIHPESSTVDVKLFSGDILRNVRVLFSSANTVAGYRYLCSIKNVNAKTTRDGIDDTANLTHEADTIAVIGFLDGNWQTPRVLGFDFPLDSQLHLKEPGLSVNAHESGVYEVITKDGHHETHYPDGSYVIFGPDTTSKDLSSIQGKGQSWNPPTSGSTFNLTIVTGGTVTINGKRVAVSGDTVSINGATGTIN